MVKPVDKRWCLPHKIHINSLLEFKSHILSRNSDLIASNIAGRVGLVRPVIKIMPSHHLLGPLSFSQHLVYFSSQYILDFLPTSEGLLGCLSISLSSCQILLSSYLFPRKFWTPPTTFENLLLSSLSIFQDLLRSDWCDGFVRLEICQKIYRTEFLGQKFYTLKMHTLRLFLLKKKQQKCINISYFSSFFC